MPLARRLPKHGFLNPFRTVYSIVNLQTLVRLGGVEQVTPQVLIEAGVVKRKTQPVKILGLGEVQRPLVIQAHKFSRSAVAKIEAAGGRAEVIGGV